MTIFLSILKNDNDYIGLLALKMADRSFRFNELWNILPKEYEYISCQAEYDDPLVCTVKSQSSFQSCPLAKFHLFGAPTLEIDYFASIDLILVDRMNPFSRGTLF